MYIVQAHVVYPVENVWGHDELKSGEHKLLIAADLDGLYEEIAKYKIRYKDWANTKIIFSHIFEAHYSEIVSDFAVEKTKTMIEHYEEEAREAESERQEALEREAEAMNAKLQDEYQTYKAEQSLKDKEAECEAAREKYLKLVQEIALEKLK